jgi:hypothetical protein
MRRTPIEPRETGHRSRRARCRRLARKLVALLEIFEERCLLSTVNWISAPSGNWNVGRNWSTGQVPGPGDDVVINVPGGHPHHHDQFRQSVGAEPPEHGPAVDHRRQPEYSRYCEGQRSRSATNRRRWPRTSGSVG